jgi:mono/diheme cytochrome c family protein
MGNAQTTPVPARLNRKASGAAALLAGWAWGMPAPAHAQDSDAAWRELVTLTCVDCHGGARIEGGVDLATALGAPREHITLWTRALDAVDDGVMPPDGALEAEDRAEWANGLLAALDVDPRDPGRPTLRRLTRAHLRNVLRDLLGVEFDVARHLPDDAAGYGFDTTGDTLFVSAHSFELWFEVVDAVLDEVQRSPELTQRIVPDDLDHASARTALAPFVERAFRRPATESELETRVALVRAELTRGRGTVDALLAAVRATLLSPSFLYRLEDDHTATTEPWPLDEFELAARLSFFLWGTVPDAALFAHARAGELHTHLDAELARLLADPRSSWLATDFAAQWLGFAELVHITPDVRRFAEFDEGLRRSMRREAEAFFDDLVRADRSVLECLDSTHVFVDARLAKHYGIEGIEHTDVRRVPTTDRGRGGVLGMAAVLTVTSEPLRTSPVKRGRYVLERLLAAPPAPPPPNAGTLPEDDRQPDGLSLRARLERHRADPSCASCHARIDPYGLALEAYDGLGRARTEVEGAPIDTRVVLPNGRAVADAIELKEMLVAEPRRFVRALAEHLFVYAVGRPPELADRAALEAAVQGAERDGYRLSALIRGIVHAPAFTHRRNPR